ncbi:MAG: hypothetical protein [Sanya fiers-like virus 48]|nr:MAG: hypothetical protein [Sanya fiers-like virus 48]
MRSGRSKVKTQEPKLRTSFQSIEEALGSRNEGASLLSQINDDLRDSSGINRTLTVHISTPEELQELARRDDLRIVIGQPIYCSFEEEPDQSMSFLVRICSAIRCRINRLRRSNVSD